MAVEAVPTQTTSPASELKTALAHTITWGIGGILAKAISFCMLPYYTHHLGPRDYGILEILDVTMTLAGMMLTMGMAPAIIRQCQFARSDSERRSVLSSSLLFTSAVAAILLSSGLMFVHPASELLLGPDVHWQYLYLSLVQLVIGYIGIVPYTYLRTKEISRSLVIFDLIGTFLLLALTIFSIGILHLGVLGMMLSSAICNALKLITLIIWVRREIVARVDFAGLKALLVFGAPFVLSNLTMFILNFSDRFFLQRFASLETVGIYAIAYKFGYMLNFLVIQPFNSMWQVRMYIVHRRQDHEQVFAHVFALYFAVLVFAALGMALFSPEIMAIAVDARFRSGAPVVGVIAAAYVWLGVGQYLQTGLFLASRTSALALMSAAVAVVTTALNAILIGRYGEMGAAWATFSGFFALAAGSYYCSQRWLPLRLGVHRTVPAITAAAGLYWAAQQLPVLSLPGVLGVKAALLGTFPLLLWKMGFFTNQDLATLAAVWHSILKTGSSLIRPAWLRFSAVFGSERS